MKKMLVSLFVISILVVVYSIRKESEGVKRKLSSTFACLNQSLSDGYSVSKTVVSPDHLLEGRRERFLYYISNAHVHNHDFFRSRFVGVNLYNLENTTNDKDKRLFFSYDKNAPKHILVYEFPFTISELKKYNIDIPIEKAKAFARNRVMLEKHETHSYVVIYDPSSATVLVGGRISNGR